MTSFTIKAIAAMARNHAIGYQGNIPWYVKGELRRFKERTMGDILLMGRKTFESTGILPGRTTIVMSKTLKHSNEIKVINHFHELTSLKELENKTIWVCGGSEIYKLALPYAEELYLTKVKQDIADADTFFPDFESLFTLDSCIEETEMFDIFLYKNKNPKTLKL